MDKSRSEDVRRRNREIIERANAELRSEKRAERRVTRFPLCKLNRDFHQLHLDLSFACEMPPVELGYMRADHSISTSVFTQFKLSEMFMDSVRSRLLLNEDHLALPDLLTTSYATEDFGNGTALTDTDARLLTDVVAAEEPPIKKRRSEATASLAPAASATPRPAAAAPATPSTPVAAAGTAASAPAASAAGGSNFDSSFARARELTERFSRGELLENPVTKRKQKARRVVELLPLSVEICERIQQVKFNENPEQLFRGVAQSGKLDSLLVAEEADDGMFKYFVRNSAGAGSEYRAVKHFEETGVTNEQFFVVTLPKTGTTGFMGPAGTKLMVKKMQQAVTQEEILVTID